MSFFIVRVSDAFLMVFMKNHRRIQDGNILSSSLSCRWKESLQEKLLLLSEDFKEVQKMKRHLNEEALLH